jgi:hypothetical protein
VPIVELAELVETNSGARSALVEKATLGEALLVLGRDGHVGRGE